MKFSNFIRKHNYSAMIFSIEGNILESKQYEINSSMILNISQTLKTLRLYTFILAKRKVSRTKTHRSKSR